MVILLLSILAEKRLVCRMAPLVIVSGRWGGQGVQLPSRATPVGAYVPRLHAVPSFWYRVQLMSIEPGMKPFAPHIQVESGLEKG